MVFIDAVFWRRYYFYLLYNNLTFVDAEDHRFLNLTIRHNEIMLNVHYAIQMLKCPKNKAILPHGELPTTSMNSRTTEELPTNAS